MKQFKLFFLLFVLMSMMSNKALAHDAEIDGIYYNFSGDEATVTFKGYDSYSYSDEYSGDIVIPETVNYNSSTYTVTTIGREAFYGCTGLTSIEIPSSVKYIGISAFSGCSGLTSIEIPNGVTSIDGRAFYECSSLTSIEISSSVTSIANGAFGGCVNLTSITIENGNTKYDSRNNCNAIIETSGNTLIAGCKNTIIPNSVTSIGHGAFYSCSGLTSIVIPSSVTSIGDEAFYSCSGLTSIEISSSLTSIGQKTFHGCSCLISVVIPKSVTSIGNNAFKNCSGLTSIEIPSSVTSIGYATFRGCSSLTSVVIPNGVTSIGSYTFAECSSLTSIEIPSSVTSIGSSAFWNCSGLTSIMIPSDVTSIGDDAFQCSGLTSVVIPSGVTTIGPYTFEGCSDLTSIEILGSVTSIGDFAFSGCTGLTSIEIPSSVTSIGNYAFDDCSGLTSIEIPSSVTTINIGAFWGCSGLTSVKVESETPISIYDDVFSNCTNATLYVPTGSKVAYEAADYWKEFKEIVEYVVEDVYYLKNVETGKYLGKGNAWGTQAVLENEGLPVRLERMSDGSYTLTFTEGSRFKNKLFRDSEITVFVDYNNQSDGCPYWTITKAETDGNYYIQSLVDHPVYGQSAMPGTYLGNNPAKVSCDEFSNPLGRYNDVDGVVTKTEGMNITWQLVPAAARCTRLQMSQILALIDLAKTIGLSTTEAEAIAANADKEQVTATISSLKSSIMQTLSDGVNESLFPLDLSALIVNPAFVAGNADGWEGSTPAFQIFNCAEFFQTTFDVHQTLTGLPNGKYHLKVKGFHRPGSNQNVYTAYKQGNRATSAVLYANGKSTKLAHHSSGARNTSDFGALGTDEVSVVYNSQTRYVPNSMYGGRRWFEAPENYYVNELPVSVKDGTLTFGVRLNQYVTQDWVLFDDFQLEYLGEEEIAENVYYLKNVETGKYLGKGNKYGTHAVLDNEGLPVRLERMLDGSYTLTFTEGSRYQKKLFRGSEGTVFVDYDNQSDCCPYWTITKAETNGTYYIQSHVDDPVYGQTAMPGTYLGNNSEKAALDEYSHSLGKYNDVDGDVTNAEGMNITWQPVLASERCTRLQMSQILALIDLAKTLGLSTTEAEAIAANADKEQVTATISSLKSSIMQKLSNGVSANLYPIDLSALIVNPSFAADNANGWEGSTPAFQLYNNAEFYEKTFDVHQTLTGLPNGEYLLKVKGFHRPGDNQPVYTAYKNGNTATTAELYANGKSTKLAHHSSGARDDGELGRDAISVVYDTQTQYVPNSMIDCRRWFDASENYYVNELPVSVNDGTLTFGVRLDESVSHGWVLFDDFQLEYLGVGITMGSSGIATYSSNVNLDFTNVEGLKAYIACGFSPSTGDLTMTRVYKIPAGEGLLLKGEPGNYDIPSAPVDYVYANLLVGVPTATTVDPTDGEYTNFILSKDELNVIGFYPLSKSGTIASGKAYLHIPSAAFATARKVNMVFEDEEEEDVTGIKDLNEKGAMSNEKFFDLQGRRVVKPTRGLYIKGGKKIMVK